MDVVLSEGLSINYIIHLLVDFVMNVALGFLKINTIFQKIWEHDEKKIDFRVFRTSLFEQYLFWIMIFSAILAILFAVSTHFIVGYHLKIIANFLVVISQVAGILYQFSFLFLLSELIRRPTRHFLSRVAESASKDYELANELSHFSMLQLNYTKDRLILECRNFRSRVGMLIGALEKIGVVPVFLSLFFSITNIPSENAEVIMGLEWLPYGVIALYVMVVCVSFFAHKLERYILLLSTAIEIKRDHVV
ncbi:hypothetical protein O4H49_03575 [Kiloniella laminariae]|uniref:ABC transmembrane type-1 domain-containing protein n=1 Tax=Kiloniella laminariae TaxID=454162 RepID=A0ABT4LFH2_9PROT|nr:hypothetical protein [Kiloniella laminariae]MCZ4279843.1 hypothetical protein [Kiloniella laminariae]